MSIKATVSEAQNAFRNWGFTNDPAPYEAMLAYREAALADGWSLQWMEGDEKTASYSKHFKDGYCMHILSRSQGKHKYKYEAKASLWCPQGIAIRAPETYDWQKIVEGTTRCHECGATGVKTVRVAFANRVCEPCLPAAKAKYEYRGWAD